MTLELFHAIADAESAAVRRFVVEHQLEERVRFRNVVYPEVEADLRARGGTRPPAVWDGVSLQVGEAACVARLSLLETFG